MKRLNKIISISVIIFFSSTTAIAQRSKHVHYKNWVPDNGYWVVESNIHNPGTNTFYFYDDNDSLVYSEKMEGRRINIKSKTTLKKLKALLDKSLLARNKINKAKEKGSLVETNLK